jgi:hypothetical protein
MLKPATYRLAFIGLLVGVLYVLIVIASHISARDGHRVRCETVKIPVVPWSPPADNPDGWQGAPAPPPTLVEKQQCRERAWWLP